MANGARLGRCSVRSGFEPGAPARGARPGCNFGICLAGLVPWLLTGWSSAGAPAWLQAVGWVALAAGAAVLLEAFGRFVVEGVGTPAPAAPTEKLVVGGLYRYVRNPMYLAVAAVILGQAAVLGRWLLVVHSVAFGATVWSFVHWYEEPTLRRQFGTARRIPEHRFRQVAPTSTGADWLNAITQRPVSKPGSNRCCSLG